MHRFVWDLHEPPPAALRHDYPIAAILHDTPREPRGRWVLPGRYVVRLTVDGRSSTQPLVVRLDPRLRLAAGALAQQFALAGRLVAALRRDSVTLERVRALGRGSEDARPPGGTAATPDSLDGQVTAVVSDLTRLNGRLADLYAVVEGADAAPTQAAEAVGRKLERDLSALETRAGALADRFRSRSGGVQ